MNPTILSCLTILTGVHLASVALAARRYAPEGGARPAAPLPRITLLRPVCGVDAFDEETLESSFLLNHPDYEILFCAERAEDPACDLVRRLIARHPGKEARLLIGEDKISGNPKLNNLVKGWAAARGDYVAMADSNLLLPPDYFDRLWEVRDEDCALVSSPAAGIRPENLWGSLECAFLNGCQARWQLAADAVGLGFAQGKTLFVEKAWLDALGGIGLLGREMAEDVAFTKLVRAQGRKVRLARQVFPHPVGRRSLRAVWDRQARWSRLRRDGFPGIFALEILQGPIPPALLLAASAPAVWLAPFLLLWWGAEWGLARLAGWPLGRRDLAATILRDLASPVLWLAAWPRRKFQWRGVAMGAAHDPA